MTLNAVRAIPAIDIHAHYGIWAAPETTNQLGMPGDFSLLLRNSAYARTALSVVSHFGTLFPIGGGSLQENEVCCREIEKEPRVLMLVSVNPRYPESFIQADRLLREDKCVGIKLHPVCHCYSIREYGQQIYEFAAERRAPIVTHSGEENCMPEDYVPLANRYPEVITVISHLGCGWDGDATHQLRAIEQNQCGNLFTDTSSWHSIEMDLLEHAVAEIGADKILFGTDSGCYFSPAQRARIDCAGIEDADKEKILYQNALRIFPNFRAPYIDGCVALEKISL